MLEATLSTKQFSFPRKACLTFISDFVETIRFLWHWEGGGKPRFTIPFKQHNALAFQKLPTKNISVALHLLSGKVPWSKFVPKWQNVTYKYFKTNSVIIQWFSPKSLPQNSIRHLLYAPHSLIVFALWFVLWQQHIIQHGDFTSSTLENHITTTSWGSRGRHCICF